MRRALPVDAPAIERLIAPVYEATMAPTHTQEGRRIFRAFVAAEAVAERLSRGNIGTLIEEEGGDAPIAYAERDGGHIRLMFVSLERQGRGLSRRLLAGLLDGYEGAAVTLNASDFARPRYEALGFLATGPRTSADGVLHTPMRKPLKTGG